MKTKSYIRKLKALLISTILFMLVLGSVAPLQRASAAAALYIKANPTTETVHVYGWPSGTKVTININRGGPVYSAIKTVGQASWDPVNANDLVASFNLSGTFDVQVGDVITATSTAGSTNTTVTNLTSVRWFIGLGAGGDPVQIPVEQQVAEDFNTSHTDLELLMEVQPSLTANGTLSAEITAGNPPDIVGPVGWRGSNAFHDQWLDLAPLITSTGYDTSPFDTTLFNSYLTDQGQEGLPFASYPSALFYNPAMFDAANLHYPPAHYGDQYQMPDTSMVDWNWDTVAQVSKLLTLDSSGRNATDPAFDSANIVQYGFSFGWGNTPNYWGSFWQSGSMLASGTPGNYVAAIPDAWKTATTWLVDGMWGTQPFIPNSNSGYLGNSNAFADGKLAMLESPSWYTCCIDNLINAGGTFQFGAMPSYNGQVSGRVDADTFRILESSSHHDQAFTVLTYLVGPAVDKLIIGSVAQPAPFSAIPALTAKQAAFFSEKAVQYPFVTAESWNILQAGVNYPDVPSAEGWMPNFNTAWDRIQAFGTRIGTTADLNIAQQMDCLQNDLQSIFNDLPAACPSVKANPTTEKVHVYGLPNGTSVNISLDRSGVIYTGTKTVGQASWDPLNTNDLVAEFDLGAAGIDLQVGDILTVTGNNETTIETVADLTSLRWFIGLAAGTASDQMSVEQQVATDYNDTHADKELMMEVQPNDTAVDTLTQEIANGDAPDIVGPVGWAGSNPFHGEWLDLETLTSWAGYDTSAFPPALLASYHTSDEGQVALPFATYPSAMFYNPALFDAAHLHYPPAHYGDQYQMPNASMVTWDWNVVAQVGRLLTLDSSGRNATNPSFDRNHIVQYGFSFGWENQPSQAGSFWQSGHILQNGGTPGNYVAAFPDAWKTAWKWNYAGMWGLQPFIPNGPAADSAGFGAGNVFSSGKIAMLDNPSWYTCCMSDFINAGGTFQLGAMPSYSGHVAGRVDADTFRIPQGSGHHEEAFTVITYFVGPAMNQLTATYGAMPAIPAKWQSALDQKAAEFPFVTADSWNILQAGLNYPDSPTAEAWMPNFSTSWARLGLFTSDVANNAGLNMDYEIAELRADVQSIFNTGASLPAPTVLSVIRASANPSASATANFTVTFSKSVRGVDKTDFSLTSSAGVTGAAIVNVSGSSATRTVTVNTGSGNGTIRLNVIDNDSITDVTSQPLGGTGSGNGSFINGQIYNINKILIFNSTDVQDGFTLESSELSNIGGTLNNTASTFSLGDDAAKRQFRSILSFNTGASLPDTAVITGVVLKLQRQGIVGGGDPLAIFQGLMVDLKNGFFGTFPALQASDFQAPASASYGPFLPPAVSNWYSINLLSGKASINKLATNAGLTQIRLGFKLDDNNNAIANYVNLYSGNAPLANRPQLVITYYVP